MAHVFLAIGALARSGLRLRGSRRVALRQLDHVAELDGPEIDLDVQVTKVGFDSATAEVGPRSGIVEVEGNLAHRFLLSS
jgi:hypothetical protein